MPRLERPDGVEIHCEATGDGPLVVLVPYWLGHPSVFEPITGELARDHRVVRYDARGTGESTRAGPHDMDTAAGDLVAVVEAAGGPAVPICVADAGGLAVRAGAARPELVPALVCAAWTAPIGMRAWQRLGVVLASDAVIEAGLEGLVADYRAALRSVLPIAMPRLTSEDELRERVSKQVAYCDQESAVGRARAGANDDPLEHSRAMGDRLWILYVSPGDMPFFAPAEQALPLIRELPPDAHVEPAEGGIETRPDLTAAAVRRITGE